ncbi:MAG: T9SS type A sorting domain-containing protein [Balneolaceae bacterium]
MKNTKILSISTLVVAALLLFSLPANGQTAETPGIIDPMGTIYSWGYNHLGQLGIDSEDETSETPSEVIGNVIFFSAGQDHSLYISEDSTLWATGSNSHGQLGINDAEVASQLSPVEVDDDVIYVSGGIVSTHYIKSDGSLWAMGRNDFSQIGVETGGENQFSPVEVTDITDVVAAEGNQINGFFLTSDGTLYGVGQNSHGQMGADPNDVADVSPDDPAEIDTDVVKFAVGFGNVSYIKTDGSLWSIGRGDAGMLGTGSTDHIFTPAQIADAAVDVDCAARNCNYLDSDGQLWAYGRNTWGNVGDGTNDNALEPVQVLHGDNVVSFGTGQRHAIFAKNDGSVWATGHNRENQMAQGDEVDQITEAEEISVGGTYDNITIVSTNGAHNLVMDQSPAPPAPKNLSAEVQMEDDYSVVELTWDDVDVSDLSHYLVSRTFDGTETSFQSETSSFNDTVSTAGDYTYTVKAVDQTTFSSDPSSELVVNVEVNVSNEKNPNIPSAYSLGQNYPNPFNPTTTISFDVPEQSHVTLTIYNVMGQQVAELVNAAKSAGSHAVVWNAQHHVSGVYFYKITAGEFTAVRKLTLLK